MLRIQQTKNNISTQIMAASLASQFNYSQNYDLLVARCVTGYRFQPAISVCIFIVDNKANV